MLTRLDRIVVAAPDAAAFARGWIDLLGAEPHHEDHVLGARRSSLRLGTGRVDILVPDGPGPVADAVSRRGAHLFCAGLATGDLAALAARLPWATADGGGLWLWAQAPIVVHPDEPGAAVGAVDELYEVTDLRTDPGRWTDTYAEWFGLDPEAFVPIDSETYGYTGTLTLFDDARLHRLEVIHPHDRTKTMGRFFDRRGDSLYMAFAETGELDAVLERARERGAPHTDAGAGTAFLHPAALGGVMLGLSARTVAWRWSGHPERVRT